MTLIRKRILSAEEELYHQIAGCAGNHPGCMADGIKIIQEYAKKVISAHEARLDTHHKIDSKPPEDGKETIIFIQDPDFSGAFMAHGYGSAREFFHSHIHSLEDGEESEINIKRKDMTKSEIEALPEF